MSLLGKVLAFLNILAAAAFVYIAMMDFTRHKNWEAGTDSVKRKIEGEPVDKSDKDVQGNIKEEDFDAFSLKTLPQLNGKPLVEQEAAIKDVESRLKKKIESSEDISVAGLENKLTTKEQKLAWVLRPLADNFDRRNGLLHVMTGKPLTSMGGKGIFKNYDELRPAMQDLDKKGLVGEADAQERSKVIAAAVPARLEKDFQETFAEVYKKPVEEKRKAIARLMFCLCEVLKDDEKPAPKSVFSSKAFEHAQAVIGMENMAKEIENQSNVLNGMAYQCNLRLEEDRARFIQEHDDRLRQIFALKELFTNLTRLRVVKENDVKMQEGLIQEQQKVIDQVTKELADLRALTEKRLKEKAEREDALLEQQKELLKKIEGIQTLGAQLRELEEKFPRREATPR
jgi:hypothetical protein